MRKKFFILFIQYCLPSIILGQTSLGFNVHLLKDTICSIEPIQIIYKVKNNSDKTQILYSQIMSPCYQPMLEYRKKGGLQWKEIKSSVNVKKNENFEICSEVEYQKKIKLNPNESFVEQINYSAFDFQRNEFGINYNSKKQIFLPNSNYDIRFKFININKDNTSDTIYSNIISLYVKKYLKKDKKALKWLMKKKTPSSIFHSISYDPISIEFNKQEIEEFITKFSNTSFTKYAELGYVQLLIGEAILNDQNENFRITEQFNKINLFLLKYQNDGDERIKEFIKQRYSEINW